MRKQIQISWVTARMASDRIRGTANNATRAATRMIWFGITLRM